MPATLFDPNATPDAAPPTSQPKKPKSELVREIQDATLGCALSHRKLGTRRSLSDEQLEKMAAQFEAERAAISGSKRLFNTKDKTYRGVGRVRREATAYWHSVTIPYPEPGVRLIRKDRIAEFAAKMQEYHTELRAAAADLQAKYEGLVAAARTELGALFNAADYPDRVDDAFDMQWSFPSLEPAGYLKQVDPDLYEREVQRWGERMEEAVRMTEEAFATQLQQMVLHLHDVLTGEKDGKQKVFRDSAVNNLVEFFKVFKSLDTGSNEDLTRLVEQAEQLVAGVDVKDLRKDVDVRNAVANGLAGMQQVLDGMVVAKPKRAIRLADEDGAAQEPPAGPPAVSEAAA